MSHRFLASKDLNKLTYSECSPTQSVSWPPIQDVNEVTRLMYNPSQNKNMLLLLVLFVCATACASAGNGARRSISRAPVAPARGAIRLPGKEVGTHIQGDITNGIGRKLRSIPKSSQGDQVQIDQVIQ